MIKIKWSRIKAAEPKARISRISSVKLGKRTRLAAVKPTRYRTIPSCSTTIIFDHRDYDSCPLKWVFV